MDWLHIESQGTSHAIFLMCILSEITSSAPLPMTKQSCNLTHSNLQATCDLVLEGMPDRRCSRSQWAQTLMFAALQCKLVFNHQIQSNFTCLQFCLLTIAYLGGQPKVLSSYIGWLYPLILWRFPNSSVFCSLGAKGRGWNCEVRGQCWMQPAKYCPHSAMSYGCAYNDRAKARALAVCVNYMKMARNCSDGVAKGFLPRMYEVCLISAW